jgi:hypothetical protein
MKQALLKFLLGPGKKILAIIVIGVSGYYGINLDFVQSMLNSPIVARPAPALVSPDAGK